jgi:hypothetical protein
MLRLLAGGAGWLGLGLLLWPHATTPARQQPPADADRAALIKLAEQALKDKGLWRGKVYLTNVETFVDRQGTQTSRKALVIHYRYDGDAALLTRLDVDHKVVLGVEEQAQFPTSLAPEEVRRAGELARANVEVKKALAKYGGPDKFGVDVVQAFTVDPEAFGYKHRLVRVFFREGREYLLYAPNVDVDLTAEQVRVRRNDKGHDKDK